MKILKGRNLGERHRELNTKVKDVVSQKLDFNQIKDDSENSDVDKLFKIDIASQYQNLDYIIDTLKSGDNLCISRALKSIWIYDDKYSDKINVENLKNNVIPFMSMKMQKKLLSAMATHIKNEDRAASFFKFCMDVKLQTIALKFLYSTSENFKLEIINDERNHSLLFSIEAKNIQHLIGLSFVLADAYVAIFYESGRLKVVQSLSYLFAVSDIKYLDLLEKYAVLLRFNNKHLGLRLSKSILKKHKNRVLGKPALYVQILERNLLAKYSSADDCKEYLTAVMPDDAQTYWNHNFCDTYKLLIKKLSTESFEYIKHLFTTKYPGEEFESSSYFYDKSYYNFMTLEEREIWAWKQIEAGSEILGSGQEYVWYKFVSFEKAFKEIKRLVSITQNLNKRADMLNILLETAKTQHDLEKILNYYYERHNNEQKYIKENFIDQALQSFNVYEFDEKCWTALDKIFHGLEIYSTTDLHSGKSEYKIIALIYHILNKKDVPEGINIYISNHMYFYLLKTHTDKLTEVQTEMVYQHLIVFMTNEVKKFDCVVYDDDLKCNLRKYIHFILDLLCLYGRTKDDCPEIANKFIKLDWAEFEAHTLFRGSNVNTLTTKDDLMRFLKKDAELVAKSLPQIRSIIEGGGYMRYDISQLLKKLKIYFSDDLTKEFLNFFNEMLSKKKLDRRIANAAVHGIFLLGDENYKVAFMKKNAPMEPKIDHVKINKKKLRIQEAICAHALYSRPPIPLDTMLMYIKGDYTMFCLPLFNSYLANLPLPHCIKFIEAILDAPVSLQKHGIRLAFKCFNAETLNQLVLDVWKKNKNVTLRKVVFKALIQKIAGDTEAQDKLFETLKTIALTLSQEDDDELFDLLTRNDLPTGLKTEFLEIAWKVVKQLPPKTAHISQMTNVINHLIQNINNTNQGVVRDIVDEFIISIFNTDDKGNTKIDNYETKSLCRAKWELTAKYITLIQDQEEFDIKSKLTKSILEKCTGPLETGIVNGRYFYREICFNFIDTIENRSYDQDLDCYENINILLQHVVESLENTIPIEEIYLLIWELRLGIVARKVITNTETKFGDNDVTEEYVSLEFAKGVRDLIAEFIKKQIYFANFAEDIKTVLLNKMKIVINQVNVPNKNDSMVLKVALELLEIDNIDIYLLVVNLLPSDVKPPYNEDLKSIMNKFKVLKNKQVMCTLFNKFVNINFNVCEFMHS